MKRITLVIILVSAVVILTGGIAFGVWYQQDVYSSQIQKCKDAEMALSTAQAENQRAKVIFETLSSSLVHSVTLIGGLSSYDMHKNEIVLISTDAQITVVLNKDFKIYSVTKDSDNNTVRKEVALKDVKKTDVLSVLVSFLPDGRVATSEIFIVTSL